MNHSNILKDPITTADISGIKDDITAFQGGDFGSEVVVYAYNSGTFNTTAQTTSRSYTATTINAVIGKLSQKELSTSGSEGGTLQSKFVKLLTRQDQLTGSAEPNIDSYFTYDGSSYDVIEVHEDDAGISRIIIGARK